MNAKAWITVEDHTLIPGFNSIAQEVIDNLQNSDVSVKENNYSYFVLELVYENYDEVKEVCSLTTYLLLNAYITEFTMTTNTSNIN